MTINSTRKTKRSEQQNAYVNIALDVRDVPLTTTERSKSTKGDCYTISHKMKSQTVLCMTYSHPVQYIHSAMYICYIYSVVQWRSALGRNLLFKHWFSWTRAYQPSSHPCAAWKSWSQTIYTPPPLGKNEFQENTSFSIIQWIIYVH